MVVIELYSGFVTYINELMIEKKDQRIFKFGIDFRSREVLEFISFSIPKKELDEIIYTYHSDRLHYNYLGVFKEENNENIIFRFYKFGTEIQGIHYNCCVANNCNHLQRSWDETNCKNATLINLQDDQKQINENIVEFFNECLINPYSEEFINDCLKNNKDQKQLHLIYRHNNVHVNFYKK
jgi:hypothetical protein